MELKIKLGESEFEAKSEGGNESDTVLIQAQVQQFYQAGPAPQR